MTKKTDDYALFIGLDRGDRLHDCAEWIPGETALHDRGQVANRPEALVDWLQGLQQRFPQGRIAVGLEQPASTLMHLLAGFPDIDVYPFNPGAVAAYRLSRKPGRVKSDSIDAEVVVRFLAERHTELSCFEPDTVLTRTIGGLVATRRKLVDLRTQLINSLIAALKAYYPQALELAGENLYAPLAIALLRKWPTFQQLKRARATSIRGFYHQYRCVRQSALDKRLELIATSVALTDDEAIVEVQQTLMRALLDQIERLQASIDWRTTIRTPHHRQPQNTLHLEAASLSGFPQTILSCSEERSDDNRKAHGLVNP